MTKVSKMSYKLCNSLKTHKIKQDIIIWSYIEDEFKLFKKNGHYQV